MTSRHVAVLLMAGGIGLAACGTGTSTSSARSASSTPRSAPTRRGPTNPGPATTAACLADSAPASAGEASPATDAVQFVTSTTGWVSGAGRILRTTDGGRHWTVQLTTGADMGEVDFLSTTTGWVVGAHELLGTVDGGSCWQVLGEPGVGSLRMVHFVSPMVGFGVAGGTFALEPAGSTPPSAPDEGFTGPFAPVDPRQGGVLVATTDGGRQWQPVAGAPDNAQSVCFVNPSDGWLGAGGGLYRSTDGARHWTEIADPGAASGTAPNGTDVEQVSCGAPSEVWVASDSGGAAAGNSPWAIFGSASGTGARLLADDMYPGAGTTSPPAPTPGSYPGPVSVIGDGVAAVAGFTPAAPPPRSVEVEVLRTDGQQVEPPEPVPGLGEVTGLAFLSARDGWIVGFGAANGTVEATVGVIEHTDDGGAVWQVQDQIGP